MPINPKAFYKKYDCSCCDAPEIDAGLAELKRRFDLGKVYLDKNLNSKDISGTANTTCATSNELILQFISPTPRCWICFMDRRWDQDPTLDGERGVGVKDIWDENFVHCFTINRKGIKKEVILDYFEYRYYGKGNGFYENVLRYYQHHPWTGTGDKGQRRIVGREADCSNPDPKWNPNYNTFEPVVHPTRR